MSLKNIHIQVPDTLTSIFIVLKLVKVIDWSWWWIVSPFFLQLVGAAVFIVAIDWWESRRV